MVMKNSIISAVFAGIAISIGTVVYLKTQGVIGSLLFSIGILMVCKFNLSLFTGKVSYISSIKQLPYIITILVGNILGATILLIFPSQEAYNIVVSKLDTSILQTFVEAALCNVLIYLAVESYKQNVVITILSIAVFILCGFEHSIANVCFIFSARLFTLDILWNFLVVTVGNAVGGIIIHNVHKRCLK